MIPSDEQLVALLRAAAAREAEQRRGAIDVEDAYRQLLKKFRRYQAESPSGENLGMETDIEDPGSFGTDLGSGIYLSETLLASAGAEPLWDAVNARAWLLISREGSRFVRVEGGRAEWRYQGEALSSPDAAPTAAVLPRPTRGTLAEPVPVYDPSSTTISHPEWILLHLLQEDRGRGAALRLASVLLRPTLASTPAHSGQAHE